MTPNPARRTTVLGTCALLAASGCGSLHYTATELIDRNVSGGPDIGSELRFAVRVAPEWLEVAVLNTGTDTVALDWGRSWFITSAGAQHGLVPAEAVGELAAAARQQLWDRRAAHTEHHAAAQLVYPGGAAGESQQLLLPWPWISKLPPGAVLTTLMYPREHVRLVAGEPVMIDPLFCTARQGPEHRFALRIPIHAGQRRDLVTLTLRTGAAQH